MKQKIVTELYENFLIGKCVTEIYFPIGIAELIFNTGQMNERIENYFHALINLYSNTRTGIISYFLMVVIV